MNKWYELGEEVKSSLKGITPKYVEKSEIIVLNQKCIRSNQIDYSFARFHDPDKTFNEKKILREGDLLFNSTGQGTAGRCAFVKDLPKGKIVITDSHILIVRIEDYNLAQCFSFACFKEEKLLQTFMDGSTGQGELDKLRLFNLEFKFPNSQKRKFICDFLNNLDRKIEINKRINTELEAMAKTIYEYWFVQFDFPDKNGKPYKSSGGKMIYNEQLKREIPEGWEVKKLSEIANLKAGGDKPKKWSKQLTKKYKTPIYSNGVTEEGLYGFTDVPKIENPSITVSARGTIGYSVLRMKPYVPIVRLISITPVNSFSLKYLHEKIKSLNYEDSGSVQKQLTVPMMTNLKMEIPPENLLKRFSEITLPFAKKIEINKEENQNLTSLRDWLLPMLMNGQVSVGEAEEELRMVAEPEEKYNV